MQHLVEYFFQQRKIKNGCLDFIFDSFALFLSVFIAVLNIASEMQIIYIYTFSNLILF